MTNYTTTQYGPPEAGYFAANDQVTDAAGTVWVCSKAGIAAPGYAMISNKAVFTPLPVVPLLNVVNVGTAATGVTAAEYGDGYNHITVLTLATALPAIAGGAALGVGKLLYTLPAGAQMIWGSKMSVGITQTQGHINADTPTVGIGTVIASGVVSVLSGTATFQNINVGKAAANCTGTATVQTVAPTSSPFSLATETGGTKTVYFNAANTWAASGDAAAALAGTVTLYWTHLG